MLTQRLKPANPLNYPLAVLVGGLLLVVGVRGVRLPSGVMLPLAGLTVLGVATWRRSQEPEHLDLGDPALEAQITAALEQATHLAAQAETLRQEAGDRLTEAHQLDLLVTVQLACDHARELPQQIQAMARKFQGQDSLVSVETLEAQLRKAKAQRQHQNGMARAQWQKLVQSLERNIALAQQGDDVRQAQVIGLSNVILETIEVLQRLQLQLRRSDLSGAGGSGGEGRAGGETESLAALGEALASCQKNLDLLMS